MTLLFISCFNCSQNKKQDFIDQKNVKKKSKGVLVCPKTHIDYGVVERGMVLKKKFLFINEGSQSVDITNIEYSCGCTSLEIPKKIIKPKDSVVIMMIVDTANKKIGMHSINAILTTNGERETYILLIKFRIK